MENEIKYIKRREKSQVEIKRKKAKARRKNGHEVRFTLVLY